MRDEADFARHVDYIHFNPVKHGHVRQVRNWPHWSFHRMVKLGGVYPLDRRARRRQMRGLSGKDEGFRCRSTHPTGYGFFDFTKNTMLMSDLLSMVQPFAFAKL